MQIRLLSRSNAEYLASLSCGVVPDSREIVFAELDGKTQFHHGRRSQTQKSLGGITTTS